MDEAQRQQALRISILDGAFATASVSLAGGIFLVGFALQILDANAFQVGILAALPTFANLLQMFGAYLIERTGQRKLLCLACVTVGRLAWLGIIFLPLTMFDPLGDSRVWVLVGIILIASLVNALAGVAWLSWMSDVVPDKIRGAYFGKRNMIALACGTVALLAGGRFLTEWGNRFGESDPTGYMLLFGVGLALGLVASFLLFRMGEPPFEPNPEKMTLRKFSLPFQDANFRRLIIFVSGWIFSIQLAGPFYGVYMIDVLEISFSQITIFITIATVATLLMMQVWGPISDRVGNKPIILVAGWGLIVVPFIWLAAVPGSYMFPLFLGHIVSGAFIAGSSLSQFNMLIKLSPSQGRSIYLAVFAAVTGVIGAFAPMIGGVLVGLLEEFRFNLGPYTVTNIHFVFLLSSIGQILVIFLILRVHEEGASKQTMVLMELRNDLDPQKGVAASSDFLIFEFRRTTGILRRMDEATERFAERSEQRVGRALNKGKHRFNKPVEWLRRFLSKD